MYFHWWFLQGITHCSTSFCHRDLWLTLHLSHQPQVPFLSPEIQPWVIRMCFLCFMSSEGRPIVNLHILLQGYWTLSTGALCWMLRRWEKKYTFLFLVIRKCLHLVIHEVQTVLQSINGNMGSVQVYWQVLTTWEGKQDKFLQSHQSAWLKKRRKGL